MTLSFCPPNITYLCAICDRCLLLLITEMQPKRWAAIVTAPRSPAHLHPQDTPVVAGSPSPSRFRDSKGVPSLSWPHFYFSLFPLSQGRPERLGYSKPTAEMATIRKWPHVPKKRFRKTWEDLKFTWADPTHRDKPTTVKKTKTVIKKKNSKPWGRGCALQNYHIIRFRSPSSHNKLEGIQRRMYGPFKGRKM